MRIVFLVNRDIESNFALNLLLPELQPGVAGIFLSERVGASRAGPARMLGQLSFIEQDLFNDLVFPLVEHSRDGADGFAGFDELERRFGIPVQPVATLKDPSILQKLRDTRADLFVSIRFGRIFGAQTLAIPARGVLNLHSGLLPDYRGVLATFRALLAGDAEIGCTLHWIDSAGIDVGPIVATARLPVARERSLFWHIVSLYRPGAAMIVEAIRRLELGDRLTGAPQDPSWGAYYSFPTDEDIVRFTAAGWRLFERDDVRGLLGDYGCNVNSTRSFRYDS
jgi:methionyl-tRNA formyltransferase